MNEYLLKLDHIKGVYDNLTAAENDATNKLYKLIDATGSIKERVEARKAHKEQIDAATAEIAKIQNYKKFLELEAALIREMIGKQIANKVKKAVLEKRKNLIDTPTHYKKFKAALNEALENESNCYISHDYYCMAIHFNGYSLPGYSEYNILTTSDKGIITAADAEKIKLYDILPVNKIEAVVTDYINAAADIKRIKEQAKKEVEEIKHRFNYNSLPL